MPANKYALIRYRCIDQCLTSKYHPYPTKEDLRAACEEAIYGSHCNRVSLSTIDKDLNAMRNDTVLGYEAPIKYSKVYGGYHYTDPDYTIAKLPISDTDVEALSFAAHTLNQFKQLPVFQEFEEVISKIKDSVTYGDGDLNMEYLDHMIFEANHVSGGTEYLKMLLSAIKEKRWVTFDYKPFQTNKVKSYKLAPHLLKEYRKRWYVVGFDLEAEKIKTFGLDRVGEVEVTPDYFIRQKDFDPNAYFLHSIGIGHYGKKPEKIVLQVEKLQAKYMLSKPMHHSLKLKKAGEDYDELTMKVILSHELVNEIMYWTPYVEVMQPKELRDIVMERVKKMQKKYRM